MTLTTKYDQLRLVDEATMIETLACVILPTNLCLDPFKIMQLQDPQVIEQRNLPIVVAATMNHDEGQLRHVADAMKEPGLRALSNRLRLDDSEPSPLLGLIVLRL